MAEKTLISKNAGGKDDIIGLPPLGMSDDDAETTGSLGVREDKLIRASLPLLRIMPATNETRGSSSEGLHLFSLNHSDGARKWQSIIKSAIPSGSNISVPQGNYVDVCYLNETSVTESFSSEYGTSRFEEVANLGSEALRELRTVTGSQSGEESLKKIADKMSGVSGMLSGVVGGAGSVLGGVEKFVGKHGMGKLLSGSRIDFPAIWKGSSYNSSHTVTVRLYNPFPGSEPMYHKTILQPLLWLLALVTPKNDVSEEFDGFDVTSKDHLTYFSPVMCSVKCPGLWEIRAGYVSSLEVIKGGENNDISFKNRPGMVDVRLSFGELYNVVTTRSGGKADRPTLKKYMTNLTDNAEVELDMFGGYETIEDLEEQRRREEAAITKPQVGTGIKKTLGGTRTTQTDQETQTSLNLITIAASPIQKIVDAFKANVEQVKSNVPSL